MTKPNILIVDDDKASRYMLKACLEESEFISLEASDGQEAIEILKKNEVGLIISDQEMPVMDGFALLKEVKDNYAEIPFIMLTAHGSIDNGVDSIKRGADDYILKPFNTEDMVSRVNRVLNYRCLTDENKKLKTHLLGLYSFQNIITRSQVMKEAISLAENVSKSPTTTVSIYGESGTGKEVLARAIHFAGDNMENNFVAINCAAVPATLLESELFGHIKGAFTGATENRKGKFDHAQGGTILLDEIGDMPLDIQAKLLRVIQERTYERIGGGQPIKVNFRIITATHRDIKKMVEDGTFRQDLYHRISPFPILLPPLRDRKDDIFILANHFLDQLRKELGKNIKGISQKAMDIFVDYKWPGNIRELKNSLERAAILANDELICLKHLNINKPSQPDSSLVANNSLQDDTKIHFSFALEEFSMGYAVEQITQMALKRCNNNKKKAAEFLKVDRGIFYRRK